MKQSDWVLAAMIRHMWFVVTESHLFASRHLVAIQM
jgi:hypothetical protein